MIGVVNFPSWDPPLQSTLECPTGCPATQSTCSKFFCRVVFLSVVVALVAVCRLSINRQTPASMANHKQPATSRWDEKKEHLSAKTRNGFEQWVKRKVRGTYAS